MSLLGLLKSNEFIQSHLGSIEAYFISVKRSNNCGHTKFSEPDVEVTEAQR